MYQLVNVIFDILYWILVARILISWIPHDPYNSFIKVIYQVSDPILAPFKRLIPPIGMVDISPIVAFLALTFLKSVILNLLR